ncbi:MAG: ATP-binding protein [Bacteroidota bacterium]
MRDEEQLITILSAAGNNPLNPLNFFSVLPVGINIQDTYHKIIYQNETDIQLYGNHKGEYCFDAFRNFPEFQDSCPLDTVFRSGGVHKTELTISSQNLVRYIDVSVSPLKNDAGVIIGAIMLSTDVSKRAGISNLLNESLKMIYDNISDIIYCVDSDFRMLSISPSVEKELGYRPEELIGKTIFDMKLLTDASLERALKNTRSLIETRTSQISNYEMITKNGDILIMEITGTVTESEGRQMVICLARNVTERYRLEEELEGYYSEVLELNDKLNASQEKLQEILSQKDKFFSIISHDLRSPFNSILGYSDYLMSDLDTLSSEEIRQFAESINISSKRLLKLVDNLLQWSLIETGQMEYYPVRTDLYELIESNFFLLQGNALKKEVEFSNQVVPGTFVIADQNTINSVIQNLLTNAIKFSHQKGIIEISARKHSDKIEIAVRDYGRGMDESEISKLFRIDVRHSSPGTSKESGTGLGLILCKELVEKNNGEIWVESQPGEGSCFYFTLPGPEI